MNIASFFSGCGGLDLGFKKAGFNIVYSNDNSKSVWETYEKNFPETVVTKENIRKIDIQKIPNDLIGIIGGPPCQSWSNAGKGKGIDDERGLLFFEYIKIIKEKQPLFFVAENVPGLLSKRNKAPFELIKKIFDESGYDLKVGVLNAANYNVPQNRRRVFFVGYRDDIGRKFEFPSPMDSGPDVYNAISDLITTPMPALNFNRSNKSACLIPNHEYWEGSYSYIFMSRNRVLSWNKPSYTIQASGRQMTLHPQAPHMTKVKKDVMEFVKEAEHLYRRLTIRECARIQTFPDDFVFCYDSLEAGYKMIGNSVPVNLSYAIANKIYLDMLEILDFKDTINLPLAKNLSVRTSVK